MRQMRREFQAWVRPNMRTTAHKRQNPRGASDAAAGVRFRLVEPTECLNRTRLLRALVSAFAVVLNPRGSQTSQAVLVDGGLPIEKLIDAQCIAGASLFETQ